MIPDLFIKCHLTIHKKYLILDRDILCIYTCVQEKTELLNSAPTSTEGALRLLSAPSGRFLQQTAICPVSL